MQVILNNFVNQFWLNYVGGVREIIKINLIVMLMKEKVINWNIKQHLQKAIEEFKQILAKINMLVVTTVLPKLK